MRCFVKLLLVAALLPAWGCKSTRTVAPSVGTVPARPLIANRPPCAPCDPGPSVFTPAPAYPPTGPFAPTPLPPGPSQLPPRGEGPFGRLPGQLPDYLPPAGPQTQQPGYLPQQPPPGARFDPWRPSPEVPQNIGQYPPNPTPQPRTPLPQVLPPQGPPRVQFGTPYPATQEPPLAEPAPLRPILPDERLQPGPKPILPDERLQPGPKPILPDERVQPAPKPILPDERVQPPGPKPILPDERVLPPEPPTPMPPEPEVNRKALSLPSPVDIPGFTEAAPKIAVGQQPFDDGITWLANQKFRTVVHLRAPGANDQVARRKFEAKGLRYVSIEVSSTTLTRGTLDELERILADEKAHPVFLYDRDGALVGGLWYLHLRMTKSIEKGPAQLDAQRLGLSPDQDAQHRAMWNAVQNLADR